MSLEYVIVVSPLGFLLLFSLLLPGFVPISFFLSVVPNSNPGPGGICEEIKQSDACRKAKRGLWRTEAGSSS